MFCVIYYSMFYFLTFICEEPSYAETVTCCGVNYKYIIHIVTLQLLCTTITLSRLIRLQFRSFIYSLATSHTPEVDHAVYCMFLNASMFCNSKSYVFNNHDV